MPLNRNIISKKIVDALIDFFKENAAKNRLYESIKITDSFPYESSQIPYVIINQNSNTQKRNDFTDFWKDNYNRVQLVPSSVNNDLVGNNTRRVNLPAQVDFNPMWAWDNSVPLPSGSDISTILFTSGTAPYDTTNLTTGVIVTVPPQNTFEPISIERAQEVIATDPYSINPIENNLPNSEWNLAIGITQNQFYLVYSGNTVSGTFTLPISPDEVVINPPNMPSGIGIKMNDVLSDGDQYILRTFSEPQFISERFGGLYNISLGFDIGALSTIERDEISDMIQRFLVEKKVNLYNSHGISLLSWSKGGNSQEAHLNEYVFKSTLATEALVEWHEDREVSLVQSLDVSAIPIGYFVSISGVIAPTASGTYYSPGIYFKNPSLQYGPTSSIYDSVVVPSGI